MARLRDVPRVARSIGLWTLVKRIWRETDEDSLFAWAAAIAYAWLFAIFPFLVFLVSLLPYLPQTVKDTARQGMHEFVEQSVPLQYRESVWKNIDDSFQHQRKGLMGLGLLITLWGASGGMNVTISALEKCYEIDRGRPYYKKRSIAAALTIVTAILVVSLVVLLPVGTIAIHWIEASGGAVIGRPLLWTWKILRWPAAVGLMLTVVHILYYYGPSIRQQFSFLTPGGVFCVAVWVLLGFVFRIYIEKFAVNNETFRTLGGVAILLVFFYFDAVVLLIGAEINSEIDFEITGLPRGTRDFTRPAAEKPGDP
jgi:membrane protein